MNSKLSVSSSLERLPLGEDAKALLTKIKSCDELGLLKLLAPFFTTSMKTIDLAVVRALQSLARGLAASGESRLPLLDQAWLLARATEEFASKGLRPFCSRCYRTVAVRRDGRFKEFCPEHASDNEASNRGGYLRGYRFSAEFAEQVNSEQFEKLVADLEYRFLRHQLFSTRKGSGAASNVVLPVVTTESNWTQGTGLTVQSLRLDEICDDFPDWTELAQRWRLLFDDQEGVQELKSDVHAVTPRLLVTQWLRWKVWSDAGDKSARVGKGRPPKIDKDAALKLRVDGNTHAQIADHFGVSKAAVAMFFTRLKAKNTEHT